MRSTDVEPNGVPATRTSWIGAVFVLLVALVLAVPGVATAQPGRAAQCDPAYGCGPPPPPSAQGQATCSLSTDRAAPGESVTATVSNIPSGAEVSVAFDGAVVGSGTAKADSPGSQQGTAKVDWTVPADATSGNHTVNAFGAGFNCDATLGVGFTVVLGATESRGAGGGGALARTGINLATYLFAALLLIVVGSRVVHEGRRRQRRVLRRRNQVHRLTPR